MSNEKESVKSKPVLTWPGMPTRRTKIVEALFVYYPIWIAVIGMSFVVTMAALNACRSAALENMKQAASNVDAE